MNEFVSSDPRLPCGPEPEMLHTLYVHPCSFYSLYSGLSGGVEACNNEWQHEMNALSTVEEAKAGTTMSRRTRKVDLLFFDMPTFSPQLSPKTFCYIFAFLFPVFPLHFVFSPTN